MKFFNQLGVISSTSAKNKASKLNKKLERKTRIDWALKNLAIDLVHYNSKIVDFQMLPRTMNNLHVKVKQPDA